MDTIFFSGGFGGHKGRPLAKSEVFAMYCAKTVYPEAKLLAYCDEESWLNMPDIAERRPIKADVGNKHGSHFNDIFRLNKLLELSNALYLDTDMFLLKRLPLDFASFASIKLNAKKAVGCLQYVREANCEVLRLHKQAYEQATPAQLGRWDYLAGTKLLQAMQAVPGSLELPGRPFSASNLLGKLYGPGAFSTAMRRDCFALHAYAMPGKQWLCQDGKPGLNEPVRGTILHDFYRYASNLHGLDGFWQY